MSRATEWLAEVHAADQRRFLMLVAGSFLAHVVLVALAGFSPPPSRSRMPDVVRVDLVALPAPAPAAAKKARPRPQPPAPKALPPSPAAPTPQPRQVLLPKEAPAAIPKKVAPVVKKTVAPKKVTPAPPPSLERPDPIAYDDALSQLRSELGEEAPAEPEIRTESGEEAGALSTGDEAGQAADAVAQAWHSAVRRHLRSCFITPPEFLNRVLVTGLDVGLTSSGGVTGEPRVIQRSGDPYFDDNAVRAVMRCAPLPAPPAPGRWRFAFTSELH